MLVGNKKNQLLGILQVGRIPVLGGARMPGQVTPPAPGLILSPSSIPGPRAAGWLCDAVGSPIPAVPVGPSASVRGTGQM